METKILNERQIALLEWFGASPFIKDNFYLTGGTALAAFYLFHRYSEDLDFFSEREIDAINLNVEIQKIKQNLPISKLDFQQSYNRNLVFFHFSDVAVKTEFTFFPFQRIEKGKTEQGIVIDSILDIAVNKLFTIYQRTQARDYIDLYGICRDQSFMVSDLIRHAKAKFDWHIDPLQLGVQFVKADEAGDYPRMISDIPPEEWRSFFAEEAKKLKPEIIL